MSFRYLFPDWEYLHDKVRRTTEIGFVCKDWKAAVKPVAFDALQLDPYDAEAVAYFDPTANGPGAKLLPLVHACHVWSTATEDVSELRRQRRRRSLSPSAGPYDGNNDDAPSAECDVKAAVLADLDRPMAENGTLCAILVHVRNLQSLVVIGVEQDISQAFRFHKSQTRLTATRVAHLTWSRPIPGLVPVAAQLYLLPELRSLRLSIPAKVEGTLSGEEGADDDDDEPGAASLVRPLEQLEDLFLSLVETSAEILAPFARLVSHVAPLESVTWLGITPAALFEKLGRGKECLPNLALGCTKPSPEACARSAWPHLRLLGARMIERVSFDLRSDPDEPDSSDSLLAVGEFLNNLPPNILHVETERNSDYDGHFSYPFQADETFSRIRTRPRAPMTTFLDNGLVSLAQIPRSGVRPDRHNRHATRSRRRRGRRRNGSAPLCALWRRGNSDRMASCLARDCGCARSLGAFFQGGPSLGAGRSRAS